MSEPVVSVAAADRRPAAPFLASVSVGWRLGFLILLGLWSLLAVAGVALVGQRDLHAIADRRQAMDSFAAASAGLAARASELRLAEAAASPDLGTDALTRFAEQTARLNAEARALRRGSVPADGGALLDSAHDGLELHGEVLAQARRGAAGDAPRRRLDETLAYATPSLVRLSELAREEAARIGLAQDRARTSALNLLLIAASAVALVFVILAVAVGRSIARPLAAAAGTANLVAEGDVVVDVPGQTRADEIGTLARTLVMFQNAQIALERVNAELRTARAEWEKRRRGERAAIATAYEAAVDDKADPLLGALGDMSLAARELARAAVPAEAPPEPEARFDLAKVSEATGRVRHEARRSGELAAGARERSAGLRGRLEDLDQAVRRIANGAGLVGDIVGQIHMLALNAALAGTRAGERGSGAAPAEELADQAVRAGDEIARLTAEVQAAVRAGLEDAAALERNADALDEAALAVRMAAEEQAAALAAIAADGETDADTALRPANAPDQTPAPHVDGLAERLAEAAETCGAQVRALVGALDGLANRIRHG